MNELRRSRASMTTTLQTICRRLDATPGARIHWTHPLAHLEFVSEVAISSVWAVGSYARGAPDCGDLDLVAELVVHDGPPPPTHVLAKALFSSPKDMRLHAGTPQVNTSNVAFPEAVLIWHGQGCDWRAAIAGIATDPLAGHFLRPADRIPLRMEQLYCDLSTFDALLALEEQKVIRWTFTPFADAGLLEPLSKDEQELSDAVIRRCGQKTRKLLPHLLAYFRQAGGWTKPYLRTNFKKSFFGIGGMKVLVGQPPVPLGLLDHLATSALLIAPHISARGPNGLWRIERGEMHPLLLAASELRVYGLFGDGGQPAFYFLSGVNSDGDSPDADTARGVDLFTSEAAASDWAEQGQEDGEPALSVRALNARELLCLLSSVDVAFIDLMDFAVTRRGVIALGGGVSTSDQELLAALAG